jgi:protein-L-isoaspartate(D-aspartate) O-methyltransferase
LTKEVPKVPIPFRWLTSCNHLIFALIALTGATLLVRAPIAGAGAEPPDPYVKVRNELVDQDIVREGITNPAVIKAMRTVPRHKFIGPKNKAIDAYDDKALPIGHGQTISPPFIVAYMTEALDPKPADRVLEIGTGSGYQAAILSEIVKEVYTIEIVEQLGKSAARNLKDYRNVYTKTGDGYKGWPEKEPFDKIIVTCSPESVPQPLIDQLRDGGKLIVPLGERYEQVFYLFEKSDGQLVKKQLLPAVFVPMTGVAEENRVVKPDAIHPEIHNGSFERVLEEGGHPTGWHYQRQLSLKTGNAPNGDKYVVFANVEPGRNSHMLQAFPVDGRKISALKINLMVKADKVQLSKTGDSACLFVRFYDGDRNPLKEDRSQMIGPWPGTFAWKPFSKTITVPAKAREGIFFLGLVGAVGELSVDDVRMTAVQR